MQRQYSWLLVGLSLALPIQACGAPEDVSPAPEADAPSAASESDDRPTPSFHERAGGAGEASTEPVTVRSAVEVLLADSLHLVEGRRVGLVTNHTGVDSDGVSTIDRLWEAGALELVALYSPEHGIRGEAQAGEPVASEQDPQTGLPIHSLYGETRRPTPEMLQGVDLLAFDIQDVGARYYTYVYTMALAMDAAGEAGIPFVVLDRPNPVDGTTVQGNVLDPDYASFVGMYPLPMRHGMTPAELALLFQGAFGVEVELHVVPAEGWRREMLFPDTGLPWIAPSPNMPDLESALHYPGTCLFEGTNLSVGRGTDRAFQQIGAPWLDGDALAGRLDRYGLEGVRFEPVRFTPEDPGDGIFDGVEVEGVRLVVTDPGIYDPTAAGVALLLETRAMSGDRWEWRSGHFDRLAGRASLREGVDTGRSLEEIRSGWEEQLREFRELREPFLLYP